MVVVVLIVLLYVVVPQLGNFNGSISMLRHPRWFYVLLGLLTFIATYLAATWTYVLLALKPLSFSNTLRVQMASMFMSRLLPAGIGSLGANFVYLKGVRYASAQATVMVTVNNLLGVIGNMVIICLVLLASPHARTMLHVTSFTTKGFVVVAVGAGIVVLVVGGLWLARHRIRHFRIEAMMQLKSYRRQKLRLLGALVSSVTLTTCNMVCFYACCQALQVNLSLLSVAVIFSVGVGVGTSTPTPGGLGGTEAGLLAGLLAVSVDGSKAIAAVLLYRMISYWFALLIGAIAFWDCQKRGLFSRTVRGAAG